MSALISCDGRELVGRLLVGERGLELALPVGVRREGDAGLGLPHGLEVDHLGGQVEDRLGHLVLLPPPDGAAELRQLRLAPAARRRTSARGRSATPGRTGRRRSRNSRIRFSSVAAPVSRGIGRRSASSPLAPRLLTPDPFLQHLHAAEAGDAVGDVDDVVAVVQVEEAVDGPRFDPPARLGPAGLSLPAASRSRWKSSWLPRTTTPARPDGTRRGRGRSPAEAGATRRACRP